MDLEPEAPIVAKSVRLAANQLVNHELLELPGLRVTLDRLVYAPELPSPPTQPHSFVYFISIHNDSDRAVTIKGRKWVVTNAHDEVTVVEGDGVVGGISPDRARGEVQLPKPPCAGDAARHRRGQLPGCG